MLKVSTSNLFEKDLKRAHKIGKAGSKLWSVVEMLARREPLQAKYRPHKLTGNWDAHIEPDWLMIYQIDDEMIYS